MKITVETNINAPLQMVWSAWSTPSDIMAWNAASDEWCCPSASVDLRVGGKLKSRMQAKDGSMGFDFEATFTAVEPFRLQEYKLGDDRAVRVEFIETDNKVLVRESFDAENTFSPEQQRDGWQAILNRFAAHVHSKF